MDILNSVMAVYDRIRHVLDILILSFLLYQVYGILLKTQAAQLLKGAVVIIVVYAAARLCNLETLRWILDILAPGVLIGMAIIFQPELRKIFISIGQGSLSRKRKISRHSNLDAVIVASEILSKKRRGMLAVFPRSTSIKDIADTGTRLNAELSSHLLVTIFEYNTPLHDGAVIIQDGKITAAGCYLPLSEQQDIRKSFGTRHRAALGMAESSDAVVLIVSEETGAVSLAYDSKIYYDLSSREITIQLEDLLGINHGADIGVKVKDAKNEN